MPQIALQKHSAFREKSSQDTSKLFTRIQSAKLFKISLKPGISEVPASVTETKESQSNAHNEKLKKREKN